MAVAERPPGQLSIRGVTKRFGGVTALRSVDLDVGAGKAVAIIGPNGAGKSTLLKIAAGIHAADAGEVRHDGTRLTGMPVHAIARRGLVLSHQVPRPFSRLSVRDNVRVAAVSRRRDGVGAQDVDEILDRFGLASSASAPASMLGALDLKRLELARALATSPTVLLLDEVAAGLTGRELRQAIGLVRSIHETGCTIVVVEHVQRVVEELVERVLVLDAGRVIADGTPSAIADDARVRELYLGSGRAAVSRGGWRPRMRPLLEVRGLSAGYGQMRALRDVDLSVGEGEVVAVLGANGAGKSTLAGAISGSVPVHGGAIRYRGEDLSGRRPHERARLGIAQCPEGRRVFARLPLEENLVLGAPLRLPKAELARRLARVHEVFPVLAERRSQPAGTLSGGEQQMLAIGRALMAEPRLLICDEISLGLAPVAVDALYGALIGVKEAGTALLLIEQSAHWSLALADRAYVLSRGHVAYAGPPEALADEDVLDAAYFEHTTTATGAAPAPNDGGSKP